jgi:hypothetical protein
MRQWIEDYKNGGTLYKEQQEQQEQPREVSGSGLGFTFRLTKNFGIFFYLDV